MVTLGWAHGIGGIGADNTNNLLLPSTLQINLVGNGYLSSKGATLAIQSVIGGTGQLIVGMTGVQGTEDWNTIQLEANNTYSGGTTVVAGTVGDRTGNFWGNVYSPYDACYANRFFGTGNVTIKFGGSARLTASTNMAAGQASSSMTRVGAAAW